VAPSTASNFSGAWSFTTSVLIIDIEIEIRMKQIE
jgi:hypothetical protein